MRFCVITVVVEINKYYIYRVCVCSFRYPAWNAHAPYCHLWHTRFCNIFPYYLTNSTIFEKKKLLNIKFVLIFSTKFIWNIYYFKKNWAKYNNYCILVFTYSTRHSYHILMKLEFSSQIFEKYPNIKFHGNPSCSNRAVPYRRMDGRKDMTNLIDNFCNFSNSPKNSTRGPSYIQVHALWHSDDDVRQTLTETTSIVNQLQIRFMKIQTISYCMFIYIRYQNLYFAGYYS